MTGAAKKVHAPIRRLVTAHRRSHERQRGCQHLAARICGWQARRRAEDVIDCAGLSSRIVIPVIVLVFCGFVGCVRVKPYEREHLSRRSMTSDLAPGAKRFEQHKTGAREGADGGTGEPGGGCGCN